MQLARLAAQLLLCRQLLLLHTYLWHLWDSMQQQWQQQHQQQQWRRRLKRRTALLSLARGFRQHSRVG